MQSKLFFRTSSCTASLHKNLSVAIILSQVFMCGVDLYDYKVWTVIKTIKKIEYNMKWDTRMIANETFLG